VQSDENASPLGRPSRSPAPSASPSSRAQILEAAAALFAEHGFSATSTRMIAERVGIRQASLYYHFAGKDDLLDELLRTSVRPSLDAVQGLEEQVAAGKVPAATALRSLALTDVDTLMRAPHNIGTLYLLPETQGERFAGFRAERAALAAAYRRLGHAAATDQVRRTVPAHRLGRILIQLVETVIELRRGGEAEARDRDALADSCLRVCGLDDDAIVAARRGAGAMTAGIR